MSTTLILYRSKSAEAEPISTAQFKLLGDGLRQVAKEIATPEPATEVTKRVMEQHLSSAWWFAIVFLLVGGGLAYSLYKLEKADWQPRILTGGRPSLSRRNPPPSIETPLSISPSMMPEKTKPVNVSLKGSVAFDFGGLVIERMPMIEDSVDRSKRKDANEERRTRVTKTLSPQNGLLMGPPAPAEVGRNNGIANQVDAGPPYSKQKEQMENHWVPEEIRRGRIF